MLLILKKHCGGWIQTRTLRMVELWQNINQCFKRKTYHFCMYQREHPGSRIWTFISKNCFFHKTLFYINLCYWGYGQKLKTSYINDFKPYLFYYFLIIKVIKKLKQKIIPQTVEIIHSSTTVYNYYNYHGDFFPCVSFVICMLYIFVPAVI